MHARELRQYKYFLTLAEELHFGRAAERSFITQSALSQQIGKLEESTGVKLLVRDHRKIRLTRAGEILRDGAQQIMQIQDETNRRMRLANSIEDYSLTIGMVEFACISMLLNAFSDLQSLYPELKLSRQEMCTARQIAALEKSQIDIGFGGSMKSPHDLLPGDGSVSSVALVTSSWRVLLSNRHPLARRREISLDQLSGQRIIMHARELNPPLYDALRLAFQCGEESPHVVYETAQVQIGVQMARNGLGCMLLPELVQCELPKGTRSVPLTDLFEVSMHMFWRTNETNPMVLDFVELAIEAAKRQTVATAA